MQPENQPSKEQPDALEVYNAVAETVGGPSLRWRDNLYQGLAILGAVLLGALAGFLLADFSVVGLGVGALAGLILGLLLSGFVLMIVGWVRAARVVRRLNNSREPNE